jgi:hypothetical protein
MGKLAIISSLLAVAGQAASFSPPAGPPLWRACQVCQLAADGVEKVKGVFIVADGSRPRFQLVRRPGRKAH